MYAQSIACSCHGCRVLNPRLTTSFAGVTRLQGDNVPHGRKIVFYVVDLHTVCGRSAPRLLHSDVTAN